MIVRHELAIQSQLRCPMFDGPLEMGGALGCAMLLMKWALVQGFNGRLVPAATLRGKFVHLWEEQFTNGQVLKDAAYYTALRLGNTAAKRIYLMLQTHEVLRPMQWYNIPFAEDKVTGEYALVRRFSTAVEIPRILILHGTRPAQHEFIDAVGIFRYLHLMIKSEYPQAGIYHLPLFEGRPWQQQDFDLALVRRAAASILSTVHQTGFPIPGFQCRDCVSHNCRSIASA